MLTGTDIGFGWGLPIIFSGRSVGNLWESVPWSSHVTDLTWGWSNKYGRVWETGNFLPKSDWSLDLTIKFDGNGLVLAARTSPDLPMFTSTPSAFDI